MLYGCLLLEMIDEREVSLLPTRHLCRASSVISDLRIDQSCSTCIHLLQYFTLLSLFKTLAVYRDHLADLAVVVSPRQTHKHNFSCDSHNLLVSATLGANSPALSARARLSATFQGICVCSDISLMHPGPRGLLFGSGMDRKLWCYRCSGGRLPCKGNAGELRRCRSFRSSTCRVRV